MIAELEWSAPFTLTSFVTNMADDSWQADNALGQTRLTIDITEKFPIFED